ncbi:MAG: hypothetical protein KAZ14_03720 [Nitrosomonas sp.]|nr:hypothetical protein [Nitrosomonas sp.]
MLLINCNPEKIDNQVVLQNRLLEPYYNGSTFRLAMYTNRRSSGYSAHGWFTPYFLDVTPESFTYNYGYYTESTYRKIWEATPENSNFSYSRLIEGDYQNCDGFDFIVNDAADNHTYSVIDIANEPEANTILYGYNGLDSISYRESKRDFSTVTSFKEFYIEELLFKPDGTFERTVYSSLASSQNCGGTVLSGNWIFNGPLANLDNGVLSSEIILSYEEVYGITPPNDMYTIKIVGNELSLEKKHIEERSRSLGVLYSISLFTDVIKKIAPSIMDDIQPGAGEFRGKPISYDMNYCFDLADFDDKLSLEQEVTLNTAIYLDYQKTYIVKDRLCGSSGSGNTSNCPDLCDEPLCGNKLVRVYDEAQNYLSQHNSDITVAADSSTITIQQFANLNGSLVLPANDYTWNFCHDYVAQTTVIDGTEVIYDHLSTALSPYDGSSCLVVYATVGGVSRIFYYH